MTKLVPLRKNEDFIKVYKKGRSKANPILAMYVLINGTAYNRLGISVSKRVGKSVIRNRVKRLIREAYRNYSGEVKEGYDIIIIARTGTKEASYKYIEKWTLNLLERHKLIQKEGTK